MAQRRKRKNALETVDAVQVPELPDRSATLDEALDLIDQTRAIEKDLRDGESLAVVGGHVTRLLERLALLAAAG